MQVNSDKAIEAGRKLVQAYGNWDNVRRNAVRQPDGSLRVSAQPQAAEGALSSPQTPRPA